MKVRDNRNANVWDRRTRSADVRRTHPSVIYNKAEQRRAFINDDPNIPALKVCNALLFAVKDCHYPARHPDVGLRPFHCHSLFC